MAQHVGTVTKSSKLPDLPFHAQCSCGTAGTFGNKEDALQYLRNHGFNVKALSAFNTFELVDNSDKPVLPKTHIGGIGNMPASHAVQSVESTKPPAPPAPPSAKTSEKPSESK